MSNFTVALIKQLACTFIKLTILSLFRDGPDIPHHISYLLIFIGEFSSDTHYMSARTIFSILVHPTSHADDFLLLNGGQDNLVSLSACNVLVKV